MKKVLWTLLFLVTFGVLAFKIPDKTGRLSAIGSLEGLPPTLIRAFDPHTHFEPIHQPGPQDWLSVHPESKQTFEQYLKHGFIQPDGQRHTIYFQPIGNFPKDRSPSLKALKEFATAYFSLKVKILPALSVEEQKLTNRINPYTKKRQILTHDILKLLRNHLPQDAFCILGITMEDLYPDPNWNFVFGMASIYQRVGVFSFVRYDPCFYGEKRTKRYKEILLRRSCKVLAHETAHMFGVLHCLFFQCIMGGSNHLQEADLRPIHLCPVCLRKLHHNIGFDVVKRYNKLLHFYKRYGFIAEAEWVEKRLNYIVGKK